MQQKYPVPPTKSKPLRPDTFYRDHAYKGGAAIARRYGGAGTVTVYAVRLVASDVSIFRIEGFGAKPADRAFCAKAYAEVLMIELALKTESDKAKRENLAQRASDLTNQIIARGHARRM